MFMTELKGIFFILGNTALEQTLHSKWLRDQINISGIFHLAVNAMKQKASWAFYATQEKKIPV